MAKAGAPRKYNRKQILLRLRDEMAKGNRPMQEICCDDGMPERQQIYLWMTEDTEEAKELYDIFMRAQELWCLAQKEICLDIAEDQSRDIITNELIAPNGATYVERRSDNTAVNRDKLRINTRQWAMAKLMPKLFGDKQQLEHSGEVKVTPLIELATKEVK